MEERLEEVYKLAKENNRILRGMRRNTRFGIVFKVVLWIFLLLGSAWGYYEYVQPALNSLLETMNQVQAVGYQIQGAADNLNQVGDGATNQLQDFLNSIPSLDIFK